MDKLQYLDFELLIEQAGQQYQATVVRSPVGEVSRTFSLPFSPHELENFILKLGATRRGTRRISSPEMKLARQLGSRLFEAVFRGDVRAGLVSSQHEAERRGLGLRLKLHLDAPELINVPWEYLYDDSLGRFLSLFEDSPIVRYIDMRGSILPLGVTPPLSVLVMISRPSGHADLDVEREQANLQSALSELIEAGLLTVTLVEKATLPALAESLLRGQYHIFHYIGHGGFDEQSQDGVLVLEDDEGQARLTSGERLAVYLGNHRTLRLVLLNACEGARTSCDDPFAGTATTLVRTGKVPAVVAMQFAITDEAAITFARGFYTALSVGRPVDAAVTQARLAIFADGNDVEWGTPVLYMRAPDGRIFDVESLTPDVLALRRRAAEAARTEREAAERRALEQRQAEVQARVDQQEAEERARREEETHQAELARLYALADEVAQAGEWSQAIGSFERVLSLDDSYEDAAARLDQARQALGRQIQLTELYDRASDRMQAQDWPEAERLLREIRAVDADYRDVEALLARVTSERDREERLSTLYGQAEAAYGQADWDGAKELYGQVWALKPDYRDTQSRMAEIQRQQLLAGQYARALEHLQARRWEDAIEGFRAVVEMDPDHGDPIYGGAATLLARARQEKERAGLPPPPASKRRRPTDLPEEIRPRDIPSVEPEEEQAKLPLPPAARRPRPTDLPEEIRPRDATSVEPEEEKAELPPPPATKRPRPAELPEEIRQRDKPKDRPA